MKYSIIIPAYNAEQFIEETILSVLNQDYKDFEVLVINDGSTDKTEEKVNSINDDRIILYTKENKGVSDSRNVGINMAKGEYILFLDADDLFPKNLFSDLTKSLNTLDYLPDIVFGDYERFDAESLEHVQCKFEYGSDLRNVKNRDIWRILFDKNDIFSMPIMAQVYRREFLKQNKLFFDEQQFIAEDTDWRYSILLKAETYFNCGICMYYYRANNSASVTNSAITLKRFLNSHREKLKWYERAMNDKSIEDIRDILLDLVSREYGHHAIQAYDIKNKAEYKVAKNMLKKHDELFVHAKQKKYQFARKIYNVFGISFYIQVFGFLHHFKCRLQHTSLY